jgi:1,4-dihydroxy-2-naphthoate octaprenyltransferase
MFSLYKGVFMKRNVKLISKGFIAIGTAITVISFRKSTGGVPIGVGLACIILGITLLITSKNH